MIRPFRRRQRQDRGDQTVVVSAPDLTAASPSGDGDHAQLDSQFLAMLTAFADADRSRKSQPADPDDPADVNGIDDTTTEPLDQGQ